jgi:hypothetical protein
MIRIPFNRCIVPTTLDFARIVERLESAIYVDPASDLSALPLTILDDRNKSPRHQGYIGQIGSFRFSATRIIGHKYFHLPTFLSPTIEGQIDSLHRRGYEISLIVKIQKATLVLLLAGLGGIFTAISSVLDSILADIKNYQFLTNVEFFGCLYLVLLAYLYFDAWRTIEFFRHLFVQRLELQIQNRVRSTADLLRENLPSFPSNSAKIG